MPILTLILALVAALYFMTTFPSEFSKGFEGDVGFWDEIDMMGVKVAFGPGYAWYLMIVSFVFALISSIILFMDKKSAIAAPPQ